MNGTSTPSITPIGHFSSLGAERLQEITEDAKNYTEFLKFYGRIFKHPISVALEFFAQHPDAKFIGSEAQWRKAGFHLQQSHEGIKFSDKNGSTVTLYDFSEIRENAPPPVWTVHSDNVKQIKAALRQKALHNMQNRCMTVSADKSRSQAAIRSCKKQCFPIRQCAMLLPTLTTAN